MPHTALIIGASRGLGLGLAREYARRDWHVVATQRSHSAELHALDGVEVEHADTTDAASIEALAGCLGDRRLDLLFVNAGVWGPQHQSPTQTTIEEAGELFMTNAVGPVAAAERLAPLVAATGVYAFMTSQMGSIADNGSGGAHLYRGSKAALNAISRSFALGPAAGHPVLLLHPGWVQTDMGGPDATTTVEDSVRGLADVIANAKPGHRYLDFRGRELPW